MPTTIHQTAEVSPKAKIGQNCRVWNWAQIRDGAELGENCIVSTRTYIDAGVKIGKNCKIQNNTSIYHGATFEDGVFAGPHTVFANDRYPRAVNPDGSLKDASDWKVSPTVVKKGAAVGAGSVVGPGVTIGEWALIGMGSVVTRDIPPYALAYGNPARVRGFVCTCGSKMEKKGEEKNVIIMECGLKSHGLIRIPKKDYAQILR